MAGKSVIDTIFVFRILRKLTMKYEKWDAFKTGVIDKKGKILVTTKERDKKQKASFNMLDRLVWNLKRLISKVQGGAKFGTNELSVVPGVNAPVNNASVVVNKNDVNNSSTIGSFSSSKNDDKSRMSLYADVMP